MWQGSSCPAGTMSCSESMSRGVGQDSLSTQRHARLQTRSPNSARAWNAHRVALGLAETPAADVEVEGVVVVLVAVGREYEVEIVAGALGEGMQEFALGSGRRPILLDAHARAVLQQEPRHIARAAGGGLAKAPRHPRHWSARIRAEVVEPDDVGRKIAPGERLRGLDQEPVHPVGETTAHNRRLVPGNGGAGDLDGVLDGASARGDGDGRHAIDRKSTRLNSSLI